MKLTKLSAAWLPAWTCRLMPAPASGMDAGTASQLIPGVRRTVGHAEDGRPNYDHAQYNSAAGLRTEISG